MNRITGWLRYLSVSIRKPWNANGGNWKPALDWWEGGGGGTLVMMTQHEDIPQEGMDDGPDLSVE